MSNIYNKYDTAEKYKEVNQYNKDLLNEFILNLKAEGKKDGTIRMYKANIKIMFVYIL